ncbi:uncharacterized protein METZ01_LOCUS275203 [marine metagenome]|uniref:Uncharacterized protein n=1 Tax=marine metagenome TaxID=408172 RepID=A0A382KDV1_9ZZZZ
MFYEVKVFDSQGHLKKVISSKKLSSRFWRNQDNTTSYYEEGHAKSEEWGARGNMKAEKVSLNGAALKVQV